MYEPSLYEVAFCVYGQSLLIKRVHVVRIILVHKPYIGAFK